MQKWGAAGVIECVSVSVSGGGTLETVSIIRDNIFSVLIKLFHIFHGLALARAASASAVNSDSLFPFICKGTTQIDCE